jgi:hypothetical protein
MQPLAITKLILGRGLINGLIYGTVYGLGLGTLVWPLIGTLIGALCGAVFGVILGAANGAALTLLTIYFFNPVSDKKELYWKVSIIASDLITAVGTYLILTLAVLRVNASWGVTKVDRVDILYLIVPITVSVLIAIWRTDRITAPYIEQFSSAK